MLKKTKLLKKLTLLLIIAFALIFFSKNSQASEGDVWLTPTNQNVDASSNFDVEVHVDTGGKDLGGFDMYFDFDATNTTIDTTQGNEGIDKGADGSNYILSINSTDIANGHLRFAGIASSGYANGSDQHIITIHAKTTSGFTSGTTNLSARINVNNGLIDKLGYDLAPGTITGATVTFANKIPIYRFFNKIRGNHFYTINSTEKDNIINNLSSTWNYEEIAYYTYSTQGYNTIPLYRFFNTSTGFHFYTKSEIEKNDIINNLPVWNYEGIAYYIYDTNVSGTTATYRFFNKIYGNHFYTTSTAERDNIINNLSGTWNYEGIAFYVLN